MSLDDAVGRAGWILYRLAYYLTSEGLEGRLLSLSCATIPTAAQLAKQFRVADDPDALKLIERAIRDAVDRQRPRW